MLDGETIRERLTLNGASLPPTPANLKYAQRVALDIKRRIAQGTFDFAEFFPESPRAKSNTAILTFGALADLWLESKGQLEAATKDQYGNAVRLWKRILGADKPIDQITHQVLSAKIGGHPWASPKSCNNYLIALRGIISLEYRGRKAMDNPMTGIKNMVVVKKLPDPFTVDEREAILADMQARYDPRVHAYFTFAFFTGVRPEEEIALRWGSIAWADAIARIERVRTFRGSERTGSKTHAERDIDLVSRAMDALQTMKAYTYMKGKEDACVFENPVTGRPWHDERSQRDHYWSPTLKRLGIRHRRAYNTRHTYATAALMGGVNPAYIARQLGHANTKMLFDKYARWIDGADKGTERRAMEAAMNAEFVPNSSHRKDKTG
ncbi:MAG: tyrosine-type recombinase/integrase [Pseudomonadota bacterium]